nr:hypothetical protein [Croceicoccus naphthovorans]
MTGLEIGLSILAGKGEFGQIMRDGSETDQPDRPSLRQDNGTKTILDTGLHHTIGKGAALARQQPPPLARTRANPRRVGPDVLDFAFHQLDLTRTAAARITVIRHADTAAQGRAQKRIARLGMEVDIAVGDSDRDLAGV